MAYTPIDFVDGSTPLNAQTFDHVEQGIVDAHAGLPPSPAGQEGKWLKSVGGAMVWNALALADIPGKGAANGLATLDANGRLVSPAQVPSYVGVHLFNTAPISIPNNAATLLAFNTIEFNSNFSYTPGSSQIVLPVSGLYLFTVGVRWPVNATGARQAGIYLRGADIGHRVEPGSGAQPLGQSVAAVYTATQGDVVNAYAFQSSGAALSVESGTYYSPNFSATLLGRA